MDVWRTEGTASTSYEEAVSNDSDSDIKEFLDSWYEKNLLNDYSKYFSDNIFCNDRTAPGKDVSLNTNDTGLGFGTNFTMFGGSTRNGFSTPPKPKISCSNKNDSFTVSDNEKGNGALKYPVGLITSDEALISGSCHFRSTSANTNSFFV